MKKLLLAVCLFAGLQASAQRRNGNWETVGEYITRDSITKKSYTLIFVNKDSVFAKAGDAVKQRMIDAFFKVYPAEAKAFNKKTLKKVTFIMDPNYKGVAATAHGVVRYAPGWMLRTPTDLDVVTHEVMHIVQDYGNGAGPGWLTEGIADYVRAVFGVDNETAKWTLPAYKPTQSYTNSYRITARFLIWAEKEKDKKLVKKLDANLRSHTYTDGLWKEYTGMTLDELWAAYAAANTSTAG